MSLWRWTLRIVKRSHAAKGFEVLPCHWAVERTLGLLGRCHRLAKDWAKFIDTAEALVLITHTLHIARLIARG